MNRLKILREAYSSKEDAIHKYVNENGQIALSIGNGFRNYVGLPITFQTHNGPEGYIRWFKIDENEEVEKVDFFDRAVTSFSDGTFNFAFAVALERSEDSFPKNFQVLRVFCARSEGRLRVKVSERDIEVTDWTNGDFDPRPVHDMIFSILLDHLAKRPGAGAKREVGFSII